MHSSIKMEVVLISFNIVAMFHRRSPNKDVSLHGPRKYQHTVHARIYILSKRVLKAYLEKFSKRVGMKFGEHTKHSTAARAHSLFQCNGATFAGV